MRLQLLLLLTASTTLVIAQEIEADSTLAPVELEPITISSPRYTTETADVPLAISKISQSRIQVGQPQLSVREALDAIPGVFALNSNNFAQDLRVSIRGFGARAAFGIRGVKVLVDGIPESTPDGQAQVDNIDLGVVERIEVIKGPSSVLYGNASGGVISLTTELTNQPFVEARYTAGNYGFQRYQFKTGWKKGKVSSVLYGVHTHLEGYRDYSAARNNNFNNKTRIEIDSATTLNLVFNYSNNPLAEDPGGLNLEEVNADRRQARQLNFDQKTGEQVEQGRAGLILNRKLSATQSIEGRVYHTFRDFDGVIPFTVIRFDRNFTGGGVKYQLDERLFSKIDYRLVAGIDYEFQQDDRQNFENNAGEAGGLLLDQKELFINKAAYLIQEISPYEKLQFTLGLRYDIIDIEAEDKLLTDGDDSGKLEFERLSPMVGVVYDFTRKISGYANISNSFETPTLSELSNDPAGLGGFNTTLEPQYATNYELGSRGRLGKAFRYELALFYIDVENELVPFELAQFPDRDFYRNAGSSDRNGIELGLTYRSNFGLTAFLTYTYSNFIYDKYEVNGQNFEGNKLPGIPQHLLYNELRYNHTSGFYAIFQTRLVGDLYAEDANSTSIDRFAVSDLRFGKVYHYTTWEFEFFTGINNLFSERYFSNIRINAFGNRFYEPAPETNFYAGVRVRMEY